MSKKIALRKKGHLNISLRENVQAGISSGFEDALLIHQALPETNRSDIDLSTKMFGRSLDAPLVLESMTGGVPEAMKLNRLLAECAEKYGLAIGVGSQRAAIERPIFAKTYSVVRDVAPNTLVFANLGAPQFASGYGIEEASVAVDMIQADALVIHANPLQESIQIEGETSFKGALPKIEEVARALRVPVIIKETGSGMSREVASQIEKVGAKGIDVAGAGGTSWAAVEYFRALQGGHRIQQKLGKIFRNWGIPTCASLVEVSRSTCLTVISSGGLRSGLDVAKSIALGAAAGGFALPVLKAAKRGSRYLNELIEILIEELRTTMFLVGARNIDDLRNVPLVLTGNTAYWLNERGYSTRDFANRRIPA